MTHPPPDPLGPTQPSQRPAPPAYPPAPDPLASYQPIPIDRSGRIRRRRAERGGCLLAILLLLGIYFLFPNRSLILVLGIDRAAEGTAAGRSDTNLLLSVEPLSGDLRLFSIPRDLWLVIPGYGEQRINAAHYFGELNAPGSGPQVAADTIEYNFGITPDRYVRIRLENFPQVIDALGGVTVDLPYKMGGLPKGKHHLNGDEALAFVRDRSIDDFERTQQGQVLAAAVLRSLFNPLKWIRLPFFLFALNDVVDTDIPFWQWPRLGLALARGALTSPESYAVKREMVTPSVTSDGAQILLPRWELIFPVVEQFTR
ncbi:MAG: LytR family transcriptional regulator [Anaerolineae bacterium]|nr:MAG: LytR family transcriptional regulator [Anaerolineae bacterium]